jgi:hypothetical protein
VAGLVVAALAAGPAAAANSTGFWVAFQGSNGNLWTLDWAGTSHDTGLGMAPNTNPSGKVVCVAGRCSVHVAFQANTGTLWTLDVGTGVPTNTGLPMLARTSPSLTSTLQTATGALGEEVAYHGSNGNLWTYVTGIGGHDTGVAILGRTSPAISQNHLAKQPVIAYQTPSGGHMCMLFSDGANRCVDDAMDPASSPSITHVDTTLPGTGESVDVAFESSDDVLVTYNVKTGALRSTGLNMAAGTNPSAVRAGFIGTDGTEVIQIAFGANTSALWLVTLGLIQRSWTVGLAAGTSPTLTETLIPVGDDGGFGYAPAIAFQGTDGRLWTVPTTGIPASTGLAMAAGASPSIIPYGSVGSTG